MELVLKKSSVTKTLFIVYFFLLATSVTAMTFQGKNVGFILFSVLAVAIILSIRGAIPRTIDESVFVVLFFLTSSFIINFWDAEINSFLYSVFYIVTYLVLVSNFKSSVPVEKFKVALFIILAGYFALLLIGQIYVLLGFFKGTHISAGLVHGQFGTLYEAASGFRYYSFSTEPSVAAFIVITAMYVYLEVTRSPRLKKSDLLVWVMGIYMIIAFQSGYGVILFFAMLFFKLSFRNSIIVILTGILFALIAVWMKLPIAERIINIFTSVDLNDIEKLRTIDTSASYRILPFYYYAINIDLMDYHFYFGHGAGMGSQFLIPFLFNVPVSEFEGGFLPQFLYDYGCIFVLAFLIFIRREVLTKWFSFEAFVILTLVTNANFNTQVFWFVITSFALKKWYTTPGGHFGRNFD
jgi:hypothetical protein